MKVLVIVIIVTVHIDIPSNSRVNSQSYPKTGVLSQRLEFDNSAAIRMNLKLSKSISDRRLISDFILYVNLSSNVYVFNSNNMRQEKHLQNKHIYQEPNKEVKRQLIGCLYISPNGPFIYDVSHLGEGGRGLLPEVTDTKSYF